MLKSSQLLLPTLLTLVAMPASATASTVCPPPAQSTEATPLAEPGEVVIACVGSQPLSEATFKHWEEVAARSSGKPPQSAHEMLVQVMGFLLSAAWVKGEAKALHIHVTASAVHRLFERIRRVQFPRDREFLRFLRKSKQTVADLLLRVELDMLTLRIQRRIMAEHRGAKAKQKALARFVVHFRTKWTSQTYCAPQYAMVDCGNVQSSL